MNHLKTLFTKYMNDGCTTAEIALLLQTFTEVKNEAELKEAIAFELQKEYGEHNDEEILNEKMLKIYGRIKPGLELTRPKKLIIRPITSYFKYSAAAILLICSTFIYLHFNNSQEKRPLTTQHQKNDVNPGGNKAILTLADGSKISLTDVENGELAKQAGITITKTADGQIVYEVAGGSSSQNNEIVYNTISTPAGGQYQINLPDGSKVWLNAQSSLKYPTIFNGVSRKVMLTGEAYFEIAKNADKPFVVSTNGAGKLQDVTVLGTHFNINSYENEKNVKTTLMEGRVQISAKVGTKVLQPGQQSVLDQRGINVYAVDANQTIDWKSGDFVFVDEGIHSIMRKLERWYDIDVVYQGNIPETGFEGEISRSKKLSEVLKVLEITNAIHFRIEGRRVTVMQ